jgi:hypothetical protein
LIATLGKAIGYARTISGIQVAKYSKSEVRKMKLAIKCASILVFVLIASPVVLLEGCGKSENTLPDKSTISIGPDHSQSGIQGDTTVNFTVVARYADGTPMPNANIKISGPFAAPRTNAHYQFYLIQDGPDNPLGNTPVNSGFTIQTGDNGSYMFSVVIFVAGGTFSDSIVGTSGSTIGSATIAVQ